MVTPSERHNRFGVTAHAQEVLNDKESKMNAGEHIQKIRHAMNLLNQVVRDQNTWDWLADQLGDYVLSLDQLCDDIREEEQLESEEGEGKYGDEDIC